VILLCRHGQTATNREGRLLGRADPPLTALGVDQAARLAARVAVERPVAVVSSPATRARETAAAIAAAAGVDTVAVEDRFVELDYGDWDGLAVGDPAIPWDRWRADAALRPPGGESLIDLRARVTAACEELAASHGDAVIVVVSHVSPIKAAVVWATGGADGSTWRMHLDLASITRVRVGRDGTPTLWGFNDVAHLLP
jgi:broad specificity phosphatase PhoE